MSVMFSTFREMSGSNVLDLEKNIQAFGLQKIRRGSSLVILFGFIHRYCSEDQLLSHSN